MGRDPIEETLPSHPPNTAIYKAIADIPGE